MTDEFDWDDVADCIVQKEAGRVAIYRGMDGDVIVREDDFVVVIAKENAVKAAKAGLDDPATVAGFEFELVSVTAPSTGPRLAFSKE